MTALARALDLPDPVARPTLWRSAVAVAAWIAFAVVAARVFALGGYTSPLLIVGSLLAIPAAIAAWVLAPLAHRGGRIAAAAMVAGLAFVPLAVQGATPSTARLGHLANDLGFPGQVVRDTRIGDGRCRKACSEIRRVAFEESLSMPALRFAIATSLKRHGYSSRVYPHRPGEPTRIDATKSHLRVQIELRAVSRSRIRVATVFIADGPAPEASVG